MLERQISGGQAGSSSRIRNVPGFPWGIGGQELAHRACEQAWLFGANLVFAQEVELAARLRRQASRGDGRRPAGDGEHGACCPTALPGAGSAIPKLESLIGAGVFYGAAMSEARAMRGRHVSIVGGGNSAGQAATHLAKYADEVTLLVRGDSLSSSMSDYLIAEIQGLPNVSVRLGVDLLDGDGDGQLEGIVIRDRTTGAIERIPTAALFVMIGAEPRTEWLDGTVERDERGYVLTGDDVDTGASPHDTPALLETSVPGVFAAGDVRHASVKRVTTAMGEGATVVQLVHQYLEREAIAPAR